MSFSQHWSTKSMLALNQFGLHIKWPHLKWEGISLKSQLYRSVVPNLGPPDVLGLQLPEILASRDGGEGFWELYSKNIWRPKVGDHWYRCCPYASDAWSNRSGAAFLNLAVFRCIELQFHYPQQANWRGAGSSNPVYQNRLVGCEMQKKKVMCSSEIPKWQQILKACLLMLYKNSETRSLEILDLDQWFPTLVNPGVLGLQSQKPSPPAVFRRVSGTCHPRTPELTKVGNHYPRLLGFILKEYLMVYSQHTCFAV